MKLELARADLLSAEESHRAQLDARAAARKALERADATDVRAWHRAYLEELRHAELVRQADKRTESARAAVHEAELADARHTIAVSLPRATRATVLSDIEPLMREAVRIDGVAPVDESDVSVPDADIAALYARDAERAKVRREILRRLAEQHAAVEAIRAACCMLGEPVPADVRELPMRHVDAWIAVEVVALNPPAEIVDADWRALMAPFFSSPTDMEIPFFVSRARSGRDVAFMIEVARELVRSGETSRAIERVLERRQTPEQREAEQRAEQNRRELLHQRAQHARACAEADRITTNVRGLLQ